MEEQINNRLEVADIVFTNPQVMHASVALATSIVKAAKSIPDGRRIQGGEGGSGAGVGPMPRLEVAASLYRGTPVFCLLELLKGFWQMPS